MCVQYYLRKLWKNNVELNNEVKKKVEKSTSAFFL